MPNKQHQPQMAALCHQGHTKELKCPWNGCPVQVVDLCGTYLPHTSFVGSSSTSLALMSYYENSCKYWWGMEWWAILDGGRHFALAHESASTDLHIFLMEEWCNCRKRILALAMGVYPAISACQWTECRAEDPCRHAFGKSGKGICS